MTRRVLALAVAAVCAVAMPIGASADAAPKKKTTAAAKKKAKSKVRKKCRIVKTTKRVKGKKTVVRKRVCKPAEKKTKRGPKTRPLPGKVTPGGGASGSGTAQSTTPVDYAKIAGLSQPTHTDVVLGEPTEVKGADGTGLYIEVNRPRKPGRYPVILESSVYHGTLYDRTGARILPDPKDASGKPLGLVGYFVPRGYVVVMMDLRGTGRSEGCLDHLGRNDLSDIKAVIDWAAAQEWSNGRVGMTGHSYLGGTTNVGGATGAEGLKTIVPSASLASMYDHQFQGGVPYNAQFLGPIEAYEQLALQADLPPLPVEDPTGNVTQTGDNFGNDPQFTGCGLANSALVAGEKQFSGQYDPVFHGSRDHKEKLKAADIPIFLQHGTTDHAARIAGADWMFERGLKPGDKLWIGQWDHGIGSAPTRRGMQWTYALQAWFDRHLGRRDVDTGPPLEVFLNDEPTDEAAWTAQGQILYGTRMPATTDFTLHANAGDGSLGGAPAAPASDSFAGDPFGFLSGNEFAGGLSFESAPAGADRTFFGVPRMKLSASTAGPRVSLIATVYATGSDGFKRRLTQCSIMPELRGGVKTYAPAVPLTRYTMTPPCFATAFTLRKGQRLLMRVTTSDDDKLPFWSVDPNVTVFTGAATDGTSITLPEVTSPQVAQDTIDVGDLSGDAASSG